MALNFQHLHILHILEPGDFILAWTDKLTIQYVSYQYSTNAIEIYILILRDLYTIWKIPSQTEKKSFYYFWIGKDIQIKNNKQLEWLSSLLTWSICDYSTYESRYDPHLYIGKMERIWCKGKEQSLKRGPTYNRLKKAVKKGNFLVWKKVF